MSRACGLVFISLLAACAPTAGLTFNERWTGTVTPADPAGCGATTAGTMTRRRDEVTFTPNDGVLVITGSVTADGIVAGTLPLIGGDHKPFPLTISGKLTPAGFEGIYTTPRCRSSVRLHPAA